MCFGLIISLTIGVLAADGGFAIRVCNWKSDWINAVGYSLIDQSRIFLDSSETILDSALCAITTKSG